MSMRYLGPSFDLHTGGIDLVFPHHEDEIAQSEAATGQPFVHTWLHCAHLHMGGEKMAKRTGNFARPADVYAAGISPRALRYALLATHYRSPLEFSETSLAAAGAAVERLDTAVAALDGYAEERADDPSLDDLLADARAAFADALADDLNISAALAAVFDLVRDLNTRLAGRSLSTADARRAAAAMRELDSVLGVLEEAPAALDAPLLELLEARAVARAARDWARSDELRDALAAAGVAVEDTRGRAALATGHQPMSSDDPQDESGPRGDGDDAGRRPGPSGKGPRGRPSHGEPAAGGHGREALRRAGRPTAGRPTAGRSLAQPQQGWSSRGTPADQRSRAQERPGEKERYRATGADDRERPRDRGADRWQRPRSPGGQGRPPGRSTWSADDDRVRRSDRARPDDRPPWARPPRPPSRAGPPPDRPGPRRRRPAARRPAAWRPSTVLP